MFFKKAVLLGNDATIFIPSDEGTLVRLDVIEDTKNQTTSVQETRCEVGGLVSMALGMKCLVTTLDPLSSAAYLGPDHSGEGDKGIDIRVGTKQLIRGLMPKEGSPDDRFKKGLSLLSKCTEIHTVPVTSANDQVVFLVQVRVNMSFCSTFSGFLVEQSAQFELLAEERSNGGALLTEGQSTSDHDQEVPCKCEQTS